MVGFDIGGTKCTASVGEVQNGSLRILQKRKIPTDLTLTPYEMIDRLCALAEEMTDDLSAIGISCGGPLDAVSGVILSPPNPPGWDEVRIVEYLQKRYGGAVCLENDANACAVAEWRFGAGRGTQNMIFLTFGTGLGAGLILDGKLYRGTCGNAGEVGHVRPARSGPIGFGKAGSFEGFASGGGLAQLGRRVAKEAILAKSPLTWCKNEAELPQVDAARLAEAARAGDAAACVLGDVAVGDAPEAYHIMWETPDGTRGENHYFANIKGVKFDTYLALLQKMGFADFGGFEGCRLN